MVLIGLLLVALVCLALGLVLASAGWLVGSLAATAVAAYVMWTKRKELAAPVAAATAPESSEPAAAPGAATPPVEDADHAGPVDTEYQQRRAAWFAEGTSAGDVWVIDGQPDYHAADCTRLVGQRAEPVPYTQATEDGFTPCPVCNPDAAVALPAATPAAAAPAPAAAAPPAPVVASGTGALDAMLEGSAIAPLPGDVWVIDGRPDYHQPGCARLADAGAEPIPLEQATEDGFTPCPECSAGSAPAPVAPVEPVAEPRPDPPTVPPPAPATRPSPSPQSSSTQSIAASDDRPGDVWVVDGRPRFHRPDCMIIKGQDSEPIPLAQAAEDGFMPCSLCEPNAVNR